MHALCLKRRSACTSPDGVGGGCCKWTTTITSVLTLTTALLFLVVTIYIYNLAENRESPFEATSGVPHSRKEIRRCGIDRPLQSHPASSTNRSAVKMSSDVSSKRRGAEGVSRSMVSEQWQRRMLEADSSRHRDIDDSVRVNNSSRARNSSVKHVKRIRYVSLFQTDSNSTDTQDKESIVVGMNNTTQYNTTRRLLNGFRQRYKTISLFQSRKLRQKYLSERRKALLTLDKRTSIDQPSLSKSTQINTSTNKTSTVILPCRLHSNPPCQTKSTKTKRREDRKKRSTNEEDVRKLKKFFIRLIEAAMGAEERTARNLTDLSLDALLKEESESNHTANETNINQTRLKAANETNINQTGINAANETNINQTGINAANATNINQTRLKTANATNINQTRLKTANETNINQTGIKIISEEQTNETLVGSSSVRKENVTRKSGIGEIGRTNETEEKEGEKLSPEVGESNLGAVGGGFGTFSSGEIGGAGNGKLIISAQIMNGSESKELGQIVVNSQNLLEVAIKVTNTSINASTEQRLWVVELNGEQKMFVAAVIAIASIVAVGTLVFACVWCLYDHEGLCMGVFPCLKPPKDNFSPQRWWMESLARRVENLESQPFLATEKYKRTSIITGTSPKHQTTNKEEGRLSQMVSRISERMSKSSHTMTKKEQMARNSQMARASQMVRASQDDRDDQMDKDTKAVRESTQRKKQPE